VQLAELEASQLDSDGEDEEDDEEEQISQNS